MKGNAKVQPEIWENDRIFFSHFSFRFPDTLNTNHGLHGGPQTPVENRHSSQKLHHILRSGSGFLFTYLDLSSPTRDQTFIPYTVSLSTEPPRKSQRSGFFKEGLPLSWSSTSPSRALECLWTSLWKLRPSSSWAHSVWFQTLRLFFRSQLSYQLEISNVSSFHCSCEVNPCSHP